MNGYQITFICVLVGLMVNGNNQTIYPAPPIQICSFSGCITIKTNHPVMPIELSTAITMPSAVVLFLFFQVVQFSNAFAFRYPTSSRTFISNPPISNFCNIGSYLSDDNKKLRMSSTATVESSSLDKETNSLTVKPIKSLDGTVTLPGSKSLSNRCLLLAALSEGNTKVENLLESDDIRYMLEALDQMKVHVERDPEDTTAVTVTGQNGPINSPLGDEEVCDLFLGNAGTAMRPLAAALCMGRGKFVLDGVPRMRERPIADLIDGLRQLGADVECVEETGCPPVTINANGLKGGKVRIFRICTYE